MARLTQEQYQTMLARGLSHDKIKQMAESRGDKLPDDRDFLQKATSIVNKIFPGGQVGKSIGTVAGLGITAAKEKLGVVPKGTTSSFDTGAPKPLQVAGDIAKGALTIGGLKMPVAAGVGGKAVQFGALGAAGGGAEALSQGEDAKEVAKSTILGAGTGAVTGAAFGLAGKAVKGISNLLGKTGEKIQTSVIKPSLQDIKDGYSMETIKKYNLGGSLKQTFTKTESTLDNLTKQLNSKLNASGKKPVLDLNKIYEKTAKRLLGTKLESFGANTQMDGALEKLRNEIIAVSGNNGLTSIPEAQIIKRAAGHFGAWSYGVPTPEATAAQKVYNTFYNEIKTSIEKASPEGVKAINKEISKLIPVMNALIKRIPVAERNSALSLTDIISLTGAAIDPRALSISLLNLASKSGVVGNVLSKTPALGQKVAGGIEKVAEPIAKSLMAR